MGLRIGYREIRTYNYRLAHEYSLATSLRPQRIVHEPVKPKKAFIVLTRDGRLTVKPRYSWDGASGPMPDIKSVMRASLVHDALYQLLRADRLPQPCRVNADKLFRELCLEDGMNPVLAWIAYIMLRLFGRPNATVQSDVIWRP